MPFDVARIQPDALICATYKWLMGPYSMGFAYLGPRFDDGEPLEETWIGRAGSENFKELVNYRDDYQPGALRYDVGERTNFALMPMAIAALEQVLDWQPERIQEYCARAHRRRWSTACGRWATPWRIRRSAAPTCSACGRRPAPTSPRRASGCARARCYVSLRGSAIRVAPHVYNDAADVEALMVALE